MARWMRVQSDEEKIHAMKLFDHMCDRGGTVVLQPIDQPHRSFDSPLSVFEAALENERRVTRAINELYALAQAEADYPSQVMLQWFITEQVEEEKNAEGILRQIQAMEGKAHLMLMLDRHLGARKAD